MKSIPIKESLAVDEVEVFAPTAGDRTSVSWRYGRMAMSRSVELLADKNA